MTKQKLQAYAVAALFSDGQDHFLSICPYIAASQDLATASVIAYVMSDSKTKLPLQMVNTIPLSVEWLRGALQHIEASEAVEEAEKPKVLHLVPTAADWQAQADAEKELVSRIVPPFEKELGDSQHMLSCPKRWGGWGQCRCGAA